MNSHPPAPGAARGLDTARVPAVPARSAQPVLAAAGSRCLCPPTAGRKAAPGPKEDREYLLSLLPHALCSSAVSLSPPRRSWGEPPPRDISQR